ncbi:hypothetical protein GGI23_000580 [Coemansia sp. RSA 2559]|nr:hypothetical protein GGI23_000580 [Coemansia sp. RSA 2559]
MPPLSRVLSSAFSPLKACAAGRASAAITAAATAAVATQKRLLTAKRTDSKYKQDAPIISPIGGNKVSVHEHETIVNDETDPTELDSGNSEEKVDKQVRDHEREIAREAARAASDASTDTVNVMSPSSKRSRVNVMSQNDQQKPPSK